jgi:nucleotide-binding universal stress UspA family protein
MPLRRIVVGVDFSPSSVAAATWCVKHFAPGAEFVLVHATESASPDGNGGSSLENIQTGGNECPRRRLEALAHGFDSECVTTEEVSGAAAAMLIAVARRTNADLIVVGRQGERATFRQRLGGVADQLLRSAPVPVLLAAGPLDAPPRRILAAVEADPMQGPVLEWAAALAQHHGGDVTALRVLSNGTLSYVLSIEAVTEGKTQFTSDEIQARFADEGALWAQRLVASGLPPARVHSEVAFGEPAEGVLAAAARVHADLIVLGRRGARPVRRFFLGSVTNDVVHLAPGPVLVVVEGAGESNGAGR